MRNKTNNPQKIMPNNTPSPADQPRRFQGDRPEIIDPQRHFSATRGLPAPANAPGGSPAQPQ